MCSSTHQYDIKTKKTRHLNDDTQHYINVQLNTLSVEYLELENSFPLSFNFNSGIKKCTKQHHHICLYNLLNLLLLLHGASEGRSRPEGFAGERYHRQVVAVADFDHHSVRVMEEELIHVDPTFLYSTLDVLYLHLLQPLLHRCHAFTLPFKGYFSHFTSQTLKSGKQN